MRSRTVSIRDAASLLGWSREEMEAAVAASEIEVVRTWLGEAIEMQEVVAKARERWPAEVIEEALGREAALVLPRGLRTRKVAARLPLYQVAMLEYLAARRQTTIAHLLAEQLDDLAASTSRSSLPPSPSSSKHSSGRKAMRHRGLADADE